MMRLQDYPVLGKGIRIKATPESEYAFRLNTETETVNLNYDCVQLLKLCNGMNDFQTIRDVITKKYEDEGLSDALVKICEQMRDLGMIEIQPSPVESHPKAIFMSVGEYSLDTVFLEVTSRCNFDCLYCYNTGPRENGSLGVITLLDQILDSPLGIMEISLTGGEPLLLKEDIFHVIRNVKKRGCKCSIQSNGSLLSTDVVRELEKAGLDCITISVDSLDPNIFSRLTRAPKNSLASVLHGIDLLLNTRIEVRIATVLVKETNDTVESIDTLIAYFQQRGIHDISITEVFPFPWIDQRLLFDLAEFPRLFHLVDLSVPALTKGTSLGKEVGTTSKRRQMCGAGTRFLYISEHALVFPCPGFPNFPIGNLQEASLEEIWESSSTLNELRRFNDLDEYLACNQCQIVNLCGGGCRAKAYLYSGDVLSPDPCACIFYRQ